MERPNYRSELRLKSMKIDGVRFDKSCAKVTILLENET